ncbi:hypothetical protein EDC94DRAFT_624591 [Helicostylum pulchrum]|nr:hypothetical protein EDC94DRAFT_624591 [Helicostylum pulchrum]
MPNFKRLKAPIKKKLGKKTTPTTQITEPPVIDTRGLAQVLKKYTIYIDDSVQYKEQLGMIAEGMGATVQHNEDDTAPRISSSVGIYILPPKTAEKTKLRAKMAKKGIRAISPAWLFTCYEKNTHLSPGQFPWDNKTTMEKLPLRSTEESDNPFGIEPVDYDYLDANRPGQQLNLDNYVTVHSKTETDSDQQTEDSDTTMNDTYEEEEEEEAMREIAYNVNKKKRSLVSIKDREERKKASKKRMSEIISAAKTLKIRYSRRERNKKKEEPDVSSSNEFGREKMKIWYAEQALPK